MERIDYSDINKFFVSVGIVLIGLAAMIPYFYLKEDFGLYIGAETFDGLREPVKEIVVAKEQAVIVFQRIVLSVSVAFFVFGTVSLVVGLVYWRRRQDKIYERFDKELHKLDLEIVALTPKEKKQKAEQEVREIVLAERQQPKRGAESVADRSVYIRRYMEAERCLTDVLVRSAGRDYDALPQQKLGNRFRLDLLLKARCEGASDKIVEIKYFRNHLFLRIVRAVVEDLNLVMTYYNERSGRKAVPVLLVVYEGASVEAGHIRWVGDQLKVETERLSGMADLRVAFIERSEMERFDAGGLLQDGCCIDENPR